MADFLPPKQLFKLRIAHSLTISPFLLISYPENTKLHTQNEHLNDKKNKISK